MKLRLLVLMFAGTGMMLAQAMVETAVSAGASAGAASGMAKAGKAIAGAMEGASKTLGEAAASETKTVSLPAVKKDAKPERTYESPDAIREGMGYGELVQRFGPPSLQLTGADGGLMLSYVRKGASREVTVREGRVATVRRADGSK